MVSKISKVLILGGTSEARRLARQLAGDARFEAMLSFAGRTESIADPGVPYRVGGFGGVDGLLEHLRREGYRALVDATHPFAAQMSRHALVAAERAELPLARLEGPPWSAVEGDRWLEVATMAEAARALGPAPLRVLSTVGRLEVAAFAAAPWHEYLIRAVDPFEPALPRARVITARGPFELAEERALLERERIDVLVSKNSGTPSTYAKIGAARELGIPVVMVCRPRLPPATTVPGVAEAIAWLENTCREAAHGSSTTKRGV
jgi:precorrin-6A/cobalt-precorrin-6A reductase